MIVCANGNVFDFCEEHEMVVIEVYEGELEKYSGVCRVLVTDKTMSESEYYVLKGKMLARGIEMVSTEHRAKKEVSEYMVSSLYEKHHRKTGGRCMFGCHRVKDTVELTDTGRAVVKRIFELRDLGYTYRKIQEDSGVHHPDGRTLSISTIQIILQNREKYEEGGMGL